MPAPTKGPRLGGSSAHEKAILKNLAKSLIIHGRIVTTEAKARRLRPYAEKLVTKARRGTLHDRRLVLSKLGERAIVHRLFADIAPLFSERAGGYTRILKLGQRRGDATPMAIVEFVEQVAPAEAAGE